MYVTRRNVPDVELLDAVFASPDTSETFARLVDAVPPGSYLVASALKGRRALLVRSPSGRTPDAVAGCGSATLNRNGDDVFEATFTSGGMTAEEAALGLPSPWRSTLRLAQTGVGHAGWRLRDDPRTASSAEELHELWPAETLFGLQVLRPHQAAGNPAHGDVGL